MLGQFGHAIGMQIPFFIMQFHIKIANEGGDLNEFSSWGPSFAMLSFWGLSF